VPAPQAWALQMLLCETQGPQQISADGMVQPGCSTSITSLLVQLIC
jgi:hypothetical protein